MLRHVPTSAKCEFGRAFGLQKIFTLQHGVSLNDNEQVQLEEIHETIGQAATYLMNSRLPVNAGNLIMVLRAQLITTTNARQKVVLEATRQHLEHKLAKIA